jgi:hypothetical protein
VWSPGGARATRRHRQAAAPAPPQAMEPRHCRIEGAPPLLRSPDPLPLHSLAGEEEGRHRRFEQAPPPPDRGRLAAPCRVTGVAIVPPPRHRRARRRSAHHAGVRRRRWGRLEREELGGEGCACVRKGERRDTIPGERWIDPGVAADWGEPGEVGWGQGAERSGGRREVKARDVSEAMKLSYFDSF